MNRKLHPKESIEYQRLPAMGDITLLNATYYQQHFSRHTHDGYAFGIITAGRLDFSYQKKNWHALPGDINLVVPGEVHDGHSIQQIGWSYRMLYLPPEILKNAVQQITGNKKLPWFLPGSITQSPLADSLATLYHCLTEPATEQLQKESLLLYWLTAFIKQYGEQKSTTDRIGKEPLAISKTIEYLHQNFTQPITLQTLSEIAGLSAYHLLRSFEKSTGLPPHLYQQQLRIAQAKLLLTEGYTPAATALQSGFFDQSHLTRHFKKITGLTPACYQKAMIHPAKIKKAPLPGC